MAPIFKLFLHLKPYLFLLKTIKCLDPLLTTRDKRIPLVYNVFIRYNLIRHANGYACTKKCLLMHVICYRNTFGVWNTYYSTFLISIDMKIINAYAIHVFDLFEILLGRHYQQHHLFLPLQLRTGDNQNLSFGTML
jgi:hypothetical protein